MNLETGYMVIAAYNSGPGKVLSAIKKSGSHNFWVLQSYLPCMPSASAYCSRLRHLEASAASGERCGGCRWPTCTSPFLDESPTPTTRRVSAAITAALFLQHFTGGLPWAHLDIASVGDSPQDNFEYRGPDRFRRTPAAALARIVRPPGRSCSMSELAA